MPDAFLIDDTRKLKYSNPNMPILVGSVSVEGLILITGKLRYIRDIIIYHSLRQSISLPSYFLDLFHGQSKQSDVSDSLDKAAPLDLSYLYWVEPNDILNFTKLLMNHYFENPRNITTANLENVSNVSQSISFCNVNDDLQISNFTQHFAVVRRHFI